MASKESGLILVTGATGLVGSALVSRLSLGNLNIRAAIRRHDCQIPNGVGLTRVGDLNHDTDWSGALESVDVVVHLAARVHVMTDMASDPLTEFRLVNVAGTVNLARQAATIGVRRLIYVSSIGVNGNSTTLGQTFTADDEPHPHDPYSISKHEAEQGLHQLAAETGLEVVIIRPPLVYGPGAPGNFGRLVNILGKSLPLPLGSIHNKRSLVALDNLVDLIVTCINHPGAANQTFLVSDGEDLSTTELLHRIGNALGKPSRLIPVPISLLEMGAVLLGRRDVTQRLCGSLQVDITKTKELLGWTPPISVDEGMRRIVLCQSKTGATSP